MGKLSIVFLPIVISMLIVLFIMPFIIRYFREKQLGQMTLEEGPNWHQEKSGTPTMGGIAFILSVILTIGIGTIINLDRSLTLWLLVIVFVAYGSIGFIDDFIKLIMKRNMGLTSKQKFISQLIIGLIFYFVISLNGFNNQLNLPFIGNIHLSYFYGVFATFWLVGFSNATNLTDGIDGLLGSTGTIAYASYAYLAYLQENWSVMIFALSIVGGLLGFLYFNRKPAQIFMGDVGSLALGAGLAAISILLNIEWTLLLIGIIFVIETASVILQVASFQIRGKRIFKMSPIHHHFEMEGWTEWKIVAIFTGVGIVSSLITIWFV